MRKMHEEHEMRGVDLGGRRGETSCSKVVCLISGGIDSIVAAYMLAQRGFRPVLVHFNNWPFSTDEIQHKVRLLANQLGTLLGEKLTLYEVPHGPNLSQIVARCRRNYTCVLCRRMMYRLAERVAREEGAGGLVTGESLGQVASQTLANLTVEHEAVSLPILRPLIGLDKEEIVRVAQRIGTFEISIMPGHCCLAVPKYPATRVNLKEVQAEEDKLDVTALVEQAICHAQKALVPA